MNKIDSSPKKNPKKNTSSQTPSPSLMPIIEGSKNSNEGDGANRREKKTNYTEKPPHWAPHIEATCAVLLVIITAMYTHYAYQQAGASINAANAAKSAADTARDSLQISERPWVSVDASPIHDLIYDTNGAANIPIRIDYRNSGATPAIQAKIEAEIIAESSNNPPHLEAQSFCKSLTPKIKNSVMNDWIMRQTYFPNVPYSNTWGLEFYPKEQGHSQAHKGFFFPIIIVCAVYKSSFENSWHYSWKSYRIIQRKPERPGTFALEDGKSIPKDQLIFAPDIYPEGAN